MNETVTEMKLSPQCIDILQYMNIKGSITGWQAVTELGVMNYKARISELRQAGVPIVTRYKTVISQNTKKRKTFAVYSIRGVEESA